MLLDSLSRVNFSTEIHSTTSSYSNLLDLIHDPVIIFDPVNGNILDVNDVACSTYAIERERFREISFGDLWVDEFSKCEMFEALLKDGVVKKFETFHHRSDGFRMNIVVNCSIIESQNGRVALSINQDITRQIRAEEGIKLATVEWRDTVDAVPDMIILEDGNGNMRRCNKTTSEFLGLPYEQMIGRPMESLFPVFLTEDLTKDKIVDTNSNNHLRRRNWEGKFKDYDQWFEVSKHPITSKVQSETRWVHVIKNITNRKIAEKQLQKFFTVVEQASSHIYITDLEGNIEYVNLLVEESTNLSKSHFLGKSIFEIKPNISEQILKEEIIPTLAKNNFWQTQNQTKQDNDQVFEQIIVSKVTDNNGNDLNYVFVCRDVTETRQLESIAEAVNMMDNVGYIFSGIRHELGNPINSVKMALTVLEKNLDKWDKEQVSVYVNRCLSEISRVEYLLRTLKSFSLHENPLMEANCLIEFMGGFISFIKGDFEKRGINISLNSKLETAFVWYDARALHQVMLNLIANAADALEEREDAEISISINRIKNRIQVIVKDNGIGMNEKQLKNSFKPFYTSKPNGTGLGLVIVHKMLVKMDGTISIDSTLSVGTQIKFTLKAVENNDN